MLYTKPNAPLWTCQVQYVCICDGKCPISLDFFLMGIQVSDPYRSTDRTQAWCTLQLVFIVRFLSRKTAFRILPDDAIMAPRYWKSLTDSISSPLIDIGVLSSSYHRLCLRNADRQTKCPTCLLIFIYGSLSSTTSCDQKCCVMSKLTFI